MLFLNDQSTYNNILEIKKMINKIKDQIENDFKAYISEKLKFNEKNE